MAQYYNFVTNASGTLTLEEVQSVQLVVEDVNNGGNGSQQFLAYTAASQTGDQAIFPQQTINLGSQISTTQLEQGQNLFIIETNEIPTPQNILKPNTVHPGGENIVNSVDRAGTKTVVECNNDNRQIQWIKMQENSINIDTVSKQNTSVLQKSQSTIVPKTQSPNNIASQTHSETQSFIPGTVERKPLRLYQGKNRHSTGSIHTVTPSVAADSVNIVNSVDNRIQNSNAPVNKTLVHTVRNKVVGTSGQNVTQVITRPVRSAYAVTPQTRATVPSSMPKHLLRLQQPEMEHLSERIKQAKLKQMQSQKQAQNEQRIQQNNTQRHVPNVLQPSTQNSSNNTMQRQQIPLQQRQQQMSPAPQLQPQKQSNMVMDQKAVQNQQQLTHNVSTDTESDKGQPCIRQCSPPQSNNVSSESVAYLQQIIDDPTTTIVQQQIEGNTAKMLVMLTNGEQRLITFDIPNEDCTVHDLLEQASITFCGETIVSLVSDAELGINYIVEAGPGSLVTANDTSDSNSQDLNSSTETSSRSASSTEENCSASTQNEVYHEPIYIEGKLALCPHCGIGSFDFSRCDRCKTKLPTEVKALPVTMSVQEKKENMLTTDALCKKNNERNSSAKLEKLERDGSISKRGRGRGRLASKIRLIKKEPECLIISSDEEDEGRTKKAESANNSVSLNNANDAFNEETETIVDKEPIITNSSVSNTSSSISLDTVKGSGTESNIQQFSDNAVQAPHTALLCRTVRIGSYKYVPQERVIISQSGMRLGVPLLEDETNFVTLDVKRDDIVKVLIHFGKSMPVLFFYTTPSAAVTIREILGMQDPKGPYYDPAGKDHTHKRITLLPEQLVEESKVALKCIFQPLGLLEELTSKEANDILVRCSPKDSLQHPSRKLSTSSTTNLNGGIQTLTVYPPPPAKGGIAINTEDYLCLAEDQFLNDVIIDFYLKYLTLEVLSEADQNRTHVFSSYFYKRLTSPHAQATESNVPVSAAMKRHARVQKWTKNVNIFEKDFIIIPINEHAHWFLAIICFPGLVGKVATNTGNPKEDDVHKTVQKSKKLKEVKVQTLTIGSTTITPVTTTITIDPADEGSERDEAEGDDEEMEMDSDDDEEMETPEADKNQQVKSENNEQKEIVKMPCILIFDSLAGASRSRVVATLRDYLSCEHVAKMGFEKTFTKDTIKGAGPKVPQQSNFTDCGLYVLQYVESFFKDPIKDYTLPIKTLKNWFEEIVVTRKREELSKLLITLINATKGDKTITLPVLNFPTQDGKLKSKPENQIEPKSGKQEPENRKKTTLDTETRVSNNMTTITENNEGTDESVTRTTYQIIPLTKSSSSSTESTSLEMLTECKTALPRSSSETMSYLKSKRIPRLMSKTESHDDNPAKKHKGESYNSCK